MPTSDFELEAQIILNGLKARGLNPDWVNSLVPITTRMGEIVARFHQQTATARNSGEFTQRGLQQRLSSVADQARRDLTTATAETLNGTRTRIDSEERQMVPRDPGGNEVVRELRAWEIRTRARDMDPLELQVHYQAAIRTGDAEFIFAIDGSPRAFPPLSAAFLAEHKQQWLEAGNPALARTVQDLRAVQETVEYLLTRATQAIDSDPAVMPAEAA